MKTKQPTSRNKQLAENLVKYIKYCINVDGVKSATNLDIRNIEDAIEFVSTYYSNTAGLVTSEPFKLVKFEGKYCPIDEPIADLIIELNARKFKTLYCCCGHEKGNTEIDYYITFDFGDNTFKLLNKVYNILTDSTEIIKYTDKKIKLEGPILDYQRYLTKIKVIKRDVRILSLENSTISVWKQQLIITYKTKHREESIDLINRKIQEAMYSL